ncbi:MAG: ThuA domain-containing protein, partial [Limisphaerales bacterium]
PALIKAVLAPHRAGIPGVNLHCAVHCYRIGNPADRAEPGSERALWFDYLGLQSSGHGAQLPIAIHFTNTNHAILQCLSDWTTINEELYNNVQVLPSATALAQGTQTVTRNGVAREAKSVVVWLNDYHGTRVFTTTIGHNNATVADGRYLDLVTRGLLWACGKLDDAGRITPGYGPKK